MNISEIETFGRIFKEYVVYPDSNQHLGTSAVLILGFNVNGSDIPNTAFDDKEYHPFIFNHPLFVLSACSMFENFMALVCGDDNQTITYHKSLPEDEINVLMFLTNALLYFDPENPKIEFLLGKMTASLLLNGPNVLPKYVKKFFSDKEYFEIPIAKYYHLDATAAKCLEWYVANPEKSRAVYQIVLDLNEATK